MINGQWSLNTFTPTQQTFHSRLISGGPILTSEQITDTNLDLAVRRCLSHTYINLIHCLTVAEHYVRRISDCLGELVDLGEQDTKTLPNTSD